MLIQKATGNIRRHDTRQDSTTPRVVYALVAADVVSGQHPQQIGKLSCIHAVLEGVV